jgi:isoleucyl-tRNA synthetase
VGAARPIEEFLDDLTNWYIRRSRGRFWAGEAHHHADSGIATGKASAYETLYEVLTTLSRLLAPFTPFVAEVLHRQLVRSQDESAPVSIHLTDWPEPQRDRDEPALLASMAALQRIVRLGHAARNEHGLKTRQPLAAVTLVTADAALPGLVMPYADLLEDELNVKEIRWAADRSQYVHHEVRPLYPKLGPKLGKRMGEVKKALEGADGDALAAEVEASGRITVELPGGPVELTADDVEIRLVERAGAATQGDRELLVALETALTPELIAELWAREVVHRLQTARKDQDLDYADRIRVVYRAAPDLATAIATHRDWIAGETLATELSADGIAAEAGGSLTEAPVEGLDFAFSIAKA